MIGRECSTHKTTILPVLQPNGKYKPQCVMCITENYQNYQSLKKKEDVRGQNVEM